MLEASAHLGPQLLLRSHLILGHLLVKCALQVPFLCLKIRVHRP
jgi:hypothetical protein